MEMYGLSTEALVLYAAIALAVVAYVTRKPTCCDRFGHDCNEGRNCPIRKANEKHD
jgi:hypothetical protein